MSERRVELVPVLLFIIAVLSAFLIYDRIAAGQRDAILQRQREFETRTVAQVRQIETKAAEQHQQVQADANAHEIELKKLELEIKRAEADRAEALVRQKEIEAQLADKKRAAEQAEAADAAAERATVEAENARQERKRAESRQHSADVRAATQDRLDAARRLNDLAWRKQTADRLVIAWRNKLAAAQHSKEKADVDLANAQAQPSRAGISAASQPPRYDPLEGPSPSQAGAGANQNSRNSASGGPTVTWVTSSRDAVDAAQAQQTGAAGAIAQAQAQLQKAQADAARLASDYASALTAKQSADRKLAVLTPEPPVNRIFATYSLLDGRKLEALCVIESGDDIWIKTGGGIEAIKRSDVEEVVRTDDTAPEK